jgi:hypothetical protein
MVRASQRQHAHAADGRIGLRSGSSCSRCYHVCLLSAFTIVLHFSLQPSTLHGQANTMFPAPFTLWRSYNHDKAVSLLQLLGGRVQARDLNTENRMSSPAAVTVGDALIAKCRSGHRHGIV